MSLKEVEYEFTERPDERPAYLVAADEWVADAPEGEQSEVAADPPARIVYWKFLRNRKLARRDAERAAQLGYTRALFEELTQACERRTHGGLARSNLAAGTRDVAFAQEGVERHEQVEIDLTEHA